MTIGISLFAIALGAILMFAVTAQAAGIDLATVGVILMVVGGIGLCVGLWLYLADRESPAPYGDGESSSFRHSIALGVAAAGGDHRLPRVNERHAKTARAGSRARVRSRHIDDTGATGGSAPEAA